MEKIKLRVTGNQIEVIEFPMVITTGTVGLPVEFAFDNQWENLTKTAVFKAGDKVVAAALEENTHTVPWEVLHKPNVWLSIGIYGANRDGTVVIPTLWAQVAMIHTGTDPEGDPALEPTNPVWQELLGRVDEIGNLLHSVDDLSLDNKAAIDGHISNREGDNPHGVTCEQIGAVSANLLDGMITEFGNRLTAMVSQLGDVELAMNNHINNADGLNPHGITCEEIGAAPAGFGLGESSSAADKSWTSSSLRNGFVRNTSGSPDGDAWHGIVCKEYGSITTDLAFKPNGGVWLAAMRGRTANGVWNNWEYVNPPMLAGVEYRTTERWMGKPVYTILVDCGEVADQKIVDLEDQFGIIRADGCILNEEDIPISPLPNGQVAWLEIAADIGVIKLCCNDDYYCSDGNTFCVQLWYVK